MGFKIFCKHCLAYQNASTLLALMKNRLKLQVICIHE